MASGEPPVNILFLQVDQLCAEAIGPYGNGFCHSPAINTLASQGTVLERAYCNFPLCAPSRFSMAAGQLCSRIGAYDNAAEFRAEIPTYAHYLRAAGYQTGLSGKMHFIGPDQYHGFDQRLTADIYPADFSWAPNWGNEGKRDTNDPRSVTISGVCERSVQIDFDEEVTYQAIQYLYDRARDSESRPFFLQVSWTHPHEPYLCLPEYWALYDGVDIPMPAVGPLDEKTHDPHSVRLLRDFGMLGTDFDEPSIRRARRAYFGSVSYIDHQIKRVLETLDRLQLSENTVVIFTSDHGDMLGERGMWFKKHFYEPALRVPLIMRIPNAPPARVDTLVSLVDLLPTFCELAATPAQPSMVESLPGTSLLRIAQSPERYENRAIYAEYLAEATTAPLLMIRQNDLKFVHSSVDGHLLFDLSEDPNELTNLAHDGDYFAVASQFQKQVQQLWDEQQLGEDIRLSQRRRLLVREAMRQGRPVNWSHGERPGEAVRWYRGEGSYNDWAFDYLPSNTHS